MLKKIQKDIYCLKESEMIRLLTEADRTKVLDYLYKEVSYNIFPIKKNKSTTGRNFREMRDEENDKYIVSRHDHWFHSGIGECSRWHSSQQTSHKAIDLKSSEISEQVDNHMSLCGIKLGHFFACCKSCMAIVLFRNDRGKCKRQK